MNKQINYNTFTLLNNYDLLNKFNFKSIYEFPAHKTAEFKTFLKDGSLAKVTQLQVESFFFFYLLGLNNIHLDLNYVASSTGRSRSVLVESNIKSKILKQGLSDFLFNFYLIINKSSRSFVVSENSLITSEKSGKPVNKKFNVISYLPANLLVEKREQVLINFNDLKIFICFEINQPILYYSKSTNNKTINLDLVYFKNIFPFWAFN
jgi:hypothetical protein